MMPSDNLRPLTYTLTGAPDASESALVAVALPALTPAVWERLAANVADEPSLTPFPAETLRERWERGHAALLLQDDEIAAYVSLAPVFSEATRHELATVLGVSDRHIPPIKVYESLTGWTAKALRKRNISLHLRQPLLARFDRPECLFIGFTAGLGASPVLAKLGWQVVPWSQIAYVGSIIENSTVDCESGAPRGWHVHGLTPYDGPPIRSFGDPGRDWAAFCYFWISNPGLALALDHQLAAITGGDVCRWRGLWGQVVESVLLDRGWVPIVLDA
jgi:hypothetical protein